MNKEMVPPPVSGLAGLLLEVRLLDLQWKKAVAFGDGAALPLGCLELLKSLASGGDQTVPQLAQAQSTSRQNIQVLVNRLKEMGQLELRSNPAHKKSVLVALTEKGRAAAAGALESERRLLDDLASRLPGLKLEEAFTILQGIRASLGRGALKDTGTRARSIRRSGPPKSEAPAEPPKPAAEPPEPAEPESQEFPVSLL